MKKSPHVDVPLLAVCIKIRQEGETWTDARVVVNNGTDFACRDTRLEAFLNGRPPGRDLPQTALDHLDDSRSDDYKKHMFRVSITSALAALMTGD